MSSSELQTLMSQLNDNSFSGVQHDSEYGSQSFGRLLYQRDGTEVENNDGAVVYTKKGVLITPEKRKEKIEADRNTKKKKSEDIVKKYFTWKLTKNPIFIYKDGETEARPFKNSKDGTSPQHPFKQFEAPTVHDSGWFLEFPTDPLVGETQMTTIENAKLILRWAAWKFEEHDKTHNTKNKKATHIAPGADKTSAQTIQSLTNTITKLSEQLQYHAQTYTQQCEGTPRGHPVHRGPRGR
jgi:hypothetical protein